MPNDQPNDTWGAATLQVLAITSCAVGVASVMLALWFWRWMRFMRQVDLGENDFGGLIYILVAVVSFIALGVSSVIAIGLGLPAIFSLRLRALAWAGVLMGGASLCAMVVAPFFA